MRNLAFFLLLSFVPLGDSFCASIPLTMTATVDKETITIGDKFTLFVEVKTTPDITVENFNPIEILSKSFEVKDYSVIGPKKHFGKRKHTYKYILSTFTTGKYKIPELTLRYLVKGEEGIKEFNSAPIVITVESVPSRPEDVDDIRDLKRNAKINISFWWYFAGIIFLLAAGGVFWWFYRQQLKQKIESIEEAEAQRPPDEIAFEKLDQLKKSLLLQEGKVKQYFIKLSEIMRQYLEKRYKINVMDKTTFELYKLLRQSDIDKKSTSKIKSLLDDCDLVKFAKFIPQNHEIESNWQEAFYIVESTKPEIMQEEPVETK
ncbi:MAG: BatD family protein [bacterium]